jgi:TolB-like protein
MTRRFAWRRDDSASKLEEYYEGPGKDDPIRIDLPKGSYMPTWEVRENSSTTVEALAPARRLARGRFLASAVVVIVAGLFVILLLISKARNRIFELVHLRQPASAIGSLAVLPFRNLSDDPKQEYVISGLNDEIITNLAKVKNLTVISRTSTDVYRGSHKRLPEIAHELHVDSVVEGTVIRSNDQIRVTAQLIRASTDSHLWAETYQRDTTDLFALQTDLAQDIAHEIGATLSPGSDSRSTDTPTAEA